jgi:hypothetical protein
MFDFNNKLKLALKYFLISLSAIVFHAQSFGQGRTFIRDNINRTGECKNVAITKTNGDVMLFGRNGAAWGEGCPSQLVTAIKNLYNENELIDDIQLTESGRWLILYGDNGFIWNNIPYSLEKKLREFNDKNELVTSVTFNDAGEWIVISTNYISSSDTRISQWLKEGNDEYGQLWAACITDDALVAVFENGFRFLGNIPTDLQRKLAETNINVFRLKIAGTAWFFADKYGRFSYNM